MVFGLLSVSKRKFKSYCSCLCRYCPGYTIIGPGLFYLLWDSSGSGNPIDPVVSGVITLSLNAGGYLAEIVRGGIESISRGQNGSRPKFRFTLWHGDAECYFTPGDPDHDSGALINQCIITLKDTSLLSVIGVTELTQTGRLIIANNYQSLEVWAIVAMMYFVIIMILSKISNELKGKMSYGKSNN